MNDYAVVAVLGVAGVFVCVAAIALQNRGSSQLAAAGFTISVIDLIVTVFFGIQAHEDATRDPASAGSAAGGFTDPPSSQSTPSPGRSSSQSSSPGQSSAPAADPRLAAVTLPLDAADTTATMYFGQLQDIVSAMAGRVTFRTDAAYLRGHGDRCAMTVVMRGVNGSSGAVFASGLGDGWGAAEAEPDQQVTTGGILHQQLVVPPAGVQPGHTWTAHADLRVGGQTTSTGSYALTLDERAGDQLQWTVGTDKTISCTG